MTSPLVTQRKLTVTVHASSDAGGRLSRAFPMGLPVVFGRDTSCHVNLPSHEVSRQHLVVTFEEHGLTFADRSAAGTFINGTHLHHDVLRVDARRVEVLVGPYRLAFEVQEHQTPGKELRRRVHTALIDRLDLSRRRLGAAVTPELRREVADALQFLAQDHGVPAAEQPRLVAELTDEALGLGPLEDLMADPNVTEVMVVDSSTIYVEREGRLELTGRAFSDSEAVRSAIERIVTPLGRRIDEAAPIVDARLPDGSRVNAVIPPLAVKGPCITIRKFHAGRLTMDDLVERECMSSTMARFLTNCVRARRNVVISGGTGSGKTTLLNVLSASIPSCERIVTIEDAAELRLRQDHVVSLESRPPNLEGRGEYTIRDLLKNALRMRPDRIVVGECRGGEALDMLQAMNTGHEGSMTTTHANSVKEAVCRLETLCLMAGVDLPLAAIRRQIASSVHLIVQQCRLSDGSRKVVSIAEVVGTNDHGEVEISEIFVFKRTSTSERGAAEGHFARTGSIPSFMDEFIRLGLVVPGVWW